MRAVERLQAFASSRDIAHDRCHLKLAVPPVRYTTQKIGFEVEIELTIGNPLKIEATKLVARF